MTDSPRSGNGPKFLFLLAAIGSSFIGAVTGSVSVAWALVNQHAARPHVGAVASERYVEDRREMRNELRDLKKEMAEVKRVVMALARDGGKLP